MSATTARYVLVLAFSLGAMHFHGVSAHAEKCDTAISGRPGESLSPLSVGPPTTVGTMRDRALTMTGTPVVRFGVAGYFTDPDGDALTYTASSSDATLASAEMCGSILKIVAKRDSRTDTDTTVVTVTASDGTGTATQSFCVSVGRTCPSGQNRGPAPEGAISDTTFTQVTSPISFFVSPYFSDPDGDDLTYSVLSSNTGKAGASITDSTLTLTAVSRGTATITVTATDPSGEDATQVFDAKITNSRPISAKAIPDITVAVGASVVVDLSEYFTDPDPEDRPRLRYLGFSFHPELAGVSVSGSAMTITGVAVGKARLLALVQEPLVSALISQYVDVTVIAQPLGPPLAVEITGPVSIASGAENTWAAQASGGTSPYAYGWDYATGCVDSGHSPGDDSCVWQWTSAGTGDSLTQTITTADTLAGVRVTATDSATPTAFSVMDSVVVSVNHAPGIVGAIAGRTIVLGHPDVRFDVAPFFSDSDGDALTYEASSSSDDTVGVSISGSTLTLSAKLANTAPDTVTVTATDPGNLSATQQFAVTVDNPSTDLAAFITGGNLTSIVSGTEYTWGSRVTGGTAPYSYNWGYATNCVDPDLLRAALCEWQWTGAGSDSSYTKTITTTKTSARIRLIVSDSASPADSVTKYLSLTVTQPSGPMPTGTISDRTLTEGGSSSSFSVSSYFRKPGVDDVLTYSASSSNTSRVTASMSGATLTIRPVAAGTATITVTATLNGQSAEQRFDVTVNRSTVTPPPQANRPPIAAGTISNRTLTLVTSPSASFGVASYFSDPDPNDVLTYSVSSSDASRVTASMSGSTLTVTAVSQGVATVTVTATDPDGLSATQQFTVTVPNRSPVAEGTISNRTLTLVTSPSASFGVTSSFSDPDGDALTYAVSSSNASRVTASMSGSTLTVTAVSQGAATVTVTATDPGNLSATQQFTVTVPNRSPVVSKTIPDTTLTAGGSSATFDLDSYFSDPDGDDLTYRVSLALTSIARARISGSTLTITPVSAGNATMNVFAEDRSGSVSQSVTVTVATAAGLSASIDGPSSITTFGSKTWTASVSGGTAPYTYGWRYKVPCSGGGAPPPGSLGAAPPCTEWTSGGALSSLTLTPSSSTTIELTVTDANSDSVTVTLSVSVSLPEDDSLDL